MKLAFVVFALLVAVCVSPSAQALNQDWGGLEDDWDTHLKSPTPDTCYAIGSQNQRCRDCKQQYNNDGQPTLYIVCAYVAQRASCGCSFRSGNCQPYGYCEYFD